MRITATRLDTGAAAAIVVEPTQEWWATGRPFDSAVFGVAQDEQRQGLP